MKRQVLITVIWLLITFIYGGFASNKAFADDGMWLPHQMQLLNLESKGIKLDPGSLYKEDGTGLMSAVVKLGGGTGEFVSPDGLLLTNHHVAYTAIQRASGKNADYLANGFLARTRAEEIPAKGYTASVLLGYNDVTSRIQKVLKPGMTPKERYEAIDRVKKKLIAKNEKKGKDYSCQVISMYSGNKYYLFTFKRLWDIRLVYAPPRSIGNFGGETDNWMWPRHTGDFTFMRAYVSPDNTGVPYHPDNVPYRPKAHFKISLEGVKPGDFTFVMGYPGRTYRNNTLAELRFDIEKMQSRKTNYTAFAEFYQNAGKNDREVEIRYASTLKALYNAIKNYTGKLSGFKGQGIIPLKEKFENAFSRWVEADPARKNKYGGILERLGKYIKQYGVSYRKLRRMETMVGRRLGPILLRQGYLVFRVVEESHMPDAKRDENYRERNLPAIKTELKVVERDYNLETDKAFFKFRLHRMSEHDKSEWPAVFSDVLSRGKDAVNRYVDGLYANTRLNQPDERMRLIKSKPSVLARSKDQLLQLAIAFEKEYKVLREKMKWMDQELADLKQIYIGGILEMTGEKIAPDANATIRFTYGSIEGYNPRDGVIYLPQTTLTGVIEKDTGKFPFNVPEKIKSLYRSKDFGPYAAKALNDVPACFINTASVTGGSSGSPILNASGEQVGIIFDMTYESVTADYYIIPKYQRTIGVDIRYVLFVTDKMAGADHLLKEIGL